MIVVATLLVLAFTVDMTLTLITSDNPKEDFGSYLIGLATLILFVSILNLFIG